MNAAGLILSEQNLMNARDFTRHRTSAAIPFGAKYRIIDFPLSNLTNAGVNSVGLVLEKKYDSLMNHVRSGNVWDLDRKHGGLTYLPPYSTKDFVFKDYTRLEALVNNRAYIKDTFEEYFIICGTEYIGCIDYRKMMAYHLEHEADMTVYFSTNIYNGESPLETLKIECDDEGRILSSNAKELDPNYVDMETSTCIISKQVLLNILDQLETVQNIGTFADRFEAYVKELKVMAYITDELLLKTEDLSSYLTANLALLNKDVRKTLFHSETGPVITKTKDSPATRYGENADVSNSFIADGVIIEGTVKNSIIFRGACIKKGAVVENSVIMQDSMIGENAHINYAVLDKKVIINDDRNLSGYTSHPFYCKRNEII